MLFNYRKVALVVFAISLWIEGVSILNYIAVSILGIVDPLSACVTGFIIGLIIYFVSTRTCEYIYKTEYEWFEKGWPNINEWGDKIE